MKPKNVVAKTLVLLDAHAIIHRAYHALPEFSSSNGEPTGALYGIVSMLLKILQELKPDYVIACYDMAEKTFRHHAFAEYKGHRQKADESLVRQITTSREIFDAFGIPIYECPGFEADDLLGTIVAQTKQDPSIRIIIATGDMDTLQLVDDKRVQVYTLRKGIQDTVLYDEDTVRERFGFGPEHIPDYKGLRGDPSDNIPGVKGIGEKTGTELVIHFGTIEQLYEAIEHDRDAVQKKVKERIINLLLQEKESAQFSKTLATIRRDAPITFVLPDHTFLSSLSLERIEPLLHKFEFKSLINRVRSFTTQQGNSQSDHMQSVESLPGLNASDLEKVKRLGIMLFLLDSSKLNPTLQDILAYTKQKTLADAEKSLHAALDREQLTAVFREIEEPIISIVDGMKEYGIGIDPLYFKSLSIEYHAKLAALERDIHQLAGMSFNINSPKQLAEVLFEKLKLAARGKPGKSGSLSTRSEILDELVDEHPIAGKILEYRELGKLLSTYIDVIPTLVGNDGRLHPTFIQTGAVTGRFSSENPNVQNIPIKTELGRAIRKGFIATPGRQFIACDYSQIELRVAALLSKDLKLITIFKEGKDVHGSVAALVFGVPENEVSYEMRRRAKVINFGMLYGMGVRALKKQLGTSLPEAQEFLSTYRKTFTQLHTYMETIIDDAKKKGYTETLFGRRRHFSSLRSPMPHIRAQAERMAINAPIQGTSADMIKLAIRFVAEDIDRAGLASHAHLVLQIHDELVYEVDEKHAAVVERIICNAMESVLERSFLKYQSPVPIVVDSATGAHLGEV